jgi:hypothetical protein
VGTETGLNPLPAFCEKSRMWDTNCHCLTRLWAEFVVTTVAKLVVTKSECYFVRAPFYPNVGLLYKLQHNGQLYFNIRLKMKN